jgi:oxygen-independent coproporphyrinogen III oxidase
MDRFLAALCSEIELVAAMPWASGRSLRSVFVGGGTPSLASGDEMASVLERLRVGFGIEPGAEITVECNPESVSRPRLEAYRRAGVNRISLGVQSLDDRVLPRLDRAHSAETARRAFDAAREAGFDNVSADLIYGLPGLDGAIWERTVRDVLAWEPEHVSAYALTLDEGSRWHATGVPDLPPEEAITSQYWSLVRLAGLAGYEHYEISNYARPGRRSAHNQIYWRAEEYVAFGPGAAGYLGDARYTNVKPVERYCAVVERGEAPIGSHELLVEQQKSAERLILGLRLSDGIPTAWLDARIALGPPRLAALVDTWREEGLLLAADGRTRLTERGFLVSDAFFVELL